MIFWQKNAFFLKSHDFVFARGTVVLSREARPCLLETEKKRVFCFFFFRERHGFAFARGTDVPLSERKKTYFLFFFLSREAQFCFRERHGCAFTRVTVVPLGNEKKDYLFFFARSTILLPWEARPCLLENRKDTLFLCFFLSQEARLWFHQRHGRASFGKGKTRAPDSVFSSGFFMEKKFVKTYQHEI